MAHTVFLASTLVLAASLAYGLPPKSDASSDWKYAHGWDGTILPSIGTPVALPNQTATLTPLTVGGIYICENINWGGKCGYAVQPTNRCIKLGTDWKNKISSFGPDICTGCTLFARDDCRWEETPQDPAVDYTGSWFIDYPGDASGGLGNDPRKGAWNDRVKSFACEYEC